MSEKETEYSSLEAPEVDDSKPDANKLVEQRIPTARVEEPNPRRVRIAVHRWIGLEPCLSRQERLRPEQEGKR